MDDKSFGPEKYRLSIAAATDEKLAEIEHLHGISRVAGRLATGASLMFGVAAGVSNHYEGGYQTLGLLASGILAGCVTSAWTGIKRDNEGILGVEEIANLHGTNRNAGAVKIEEEFTLDGVTITSTSIDKSVLPETKSVRSGIPSATHVATSTGSMLVTCGLLDKLAPLENITYLENPTIFGVGFLAIGAFGHVLGERINNKNAKRFRLWADNIVNRPWGRQRTQNEG